MANFKSRVQHPGFYTIKFKTIFSSAQEALKYLQDGGTCTIFNQTYTMDELVQVMELSQYRFYLEYLPGKSRELVL